MRNDVKMFIREMIIAILLFDLNRLAPSGWFVFLGWIWLISGFLQILIWIAEYYGITEDSLEDKK